MSRTSLWLLRISVPLAAATVLVQISYPLLHGSARDTVTILAVLLFFAASLSHAAVTGGTRCAAAVLAVAAAGWLVETVGLRTAVPFGAYSYADRLGPTLLGVPAVIPLAWAMMAWPAYLAASRLTRGRAARVTVAGWALASWDLFLDPQMTAAGHWRWHQPAPALPGVPDVPLSNHAGWLGIALLLMLVLDTVVGPDRIRHDAVPVALYLWTYASSVLAHAVFLGLPASAGWGGLGMGLVALPLAARLSQPAKVPA